MEVGMRAERFTRNDRLSPISVILGVGVAAMVFLLLSFGLQ
jgi:hypothetical protein